MTTSHSSPSPRGSVSPRLPAGSGSEPSASAQLDLEADPLPHLRRHRVAERREQLRHQQQVVVEREARALQLQQEVLARLGVEAAEAPGEGQPLEGPQAESQARQHAGRDRAQEVGDRPGDVDVALGGRQAVDARRHRRADRAQGALLSGREPWRALSTGVGRTADAAGQDPEPEREQRQEAVDEEVEQVDEDVFLDQEEGERAERGGGLADGEDEQQGAVADDVGLRRPGRCR